MQRCKAYLRIPPSPRDRCARRRWHRIASISTWIQTYHRTDRECGISPFNISEGADVDGDLDARLDVIAWDGPWVLVRFPVYDTTKRCTHSLFKFYWKYLHFTVRDIVKIVSEFYRGTFTQGELKAVTSGLRRDYVENVSRRYIHMGMKEYVPLVMKVISEELDEMIQDTHTPRIRTFFLRGGHKMFLSVLLFKA